LNFKERRKRLKRNKKGNYITAVSDEGDRVITEDGDAVIVWGLRGMKAVIVSKRGSWTPNFRQMLKQAKAVLVERKQLSLLKSQQPSLFEARH